MAEATGMNHVGFQPDSELRFDRTWTKGERPSSSAQLTNPTDRLVHFEVIARGLVNYEVKPTQGTVPRSGTHKINVIARGLPRDEQWEGEIHVDTFYIPYDCQEDLVFLSFLEKECRHFNEFHHPPLHHQAVPRHAIQHSVIRVRWVDPEREITDLMNKAVEEVSQENLGPARETLREAIDFHPDVSSLLCYVLVNHRLGQKEEANRALQEAELAEGAGERFTPSATCLSIISDHFEVPTYTKEKLCAKEMVVKWSEAVTENQRLDVEVRLTPSIMLSDGNVEVIVIVATVRFEVVPVPSEKTDSYSESHFLQSLKIVVCPTGKWSESFSEPGCDLIKWTPGNELNPETVQRGRSRGYAAGVNLGASPSTGLQLNGHRTKGTTFPSQGFGKSARDDNAYVCEYKLRTFKDGSSTENLDGKLFFKDPDIPEAAKGHNNYNLSDFAGTWSVPKQTAEDLRNQIEFTISVEAKLPAVRRFIMSKPKHWVNPPKPVLVNLKLEPRRVTCAFDIARSKRFIENSK